MSEMLKVIRVLKKYRRFFLSAHIHLEGDALGSLLAMGGLIRKLGKQAVLINQDEAPKAYDFLPGLDKIRPFKNGVPKCEVAIALDCADLGRLGSSLAPLFQSAPLTVNIDHHVTNTRFADVNWVDPGASSASEMVFRIYQKMGVSLDHNSSLQLYTGIMTDTGSFRFSNTTPFTHEVAAKLLRRGLKLEKIYSMVYERLSWDEFRGLIRILNTLKLDADGKVAWMESSLEMCPAYLETDSDIGELALHLVRWMEKVEVAVLFKSLEDSRKVRVKLRSQGRIDVGKLAQEFQGGGHHNASGCTLAASLEEAKAKVLGRLRGIIRQR